MPTDFLSPAKRSELMSRVRGKNTKPEMVVRKLVFSLGYRYRLHQGGLPGKPDLVFKGRKKVIFVHGCFWHMHQCKKFSMPISNQDFWTEKLQKNRERDDRNERLLKELGWAWLVIWECDLKDKDALSLKIVKFMDE